ncbi:MAG: hypothetical protein R3F11_18990 [Verrucomicrobiales bacterium]
MWWTDHSDEDHSLPAGNFTGTPDGDGVAISPDGVTCGASGRRPASTRRVARTPDHRPRPDQGGVST